MPGNPQRFAQIAGILQKPPHFQTQRVNKVDILVWHGTRKAAKFAQSQVV